MTEMQSTPTDRCRHGHHLLLICRECDNGTDSILADEPTETQNHRARLAPGEIRTHTVGNRTFRVMHVAGGSFTQASVHAKGEPTRVLHTGREDIAVSRYADAIEQAESDAVDALDDADGMSFDASGAYLDGDGRTPSGPLDFNLPMGASSVLVTDEPLGEMLPTPEPGSLSALLDAYGEAMSKGATCLVLGRTAELISYANRADALKAEILARFGGER